MTRYQRLKRELGEVRLAARQLDDRAESLAAELARESATEVEIMAMGGAR